MPVAVGAELVKSGAWVTVIENPWLAFGRVPLVATIVPVNVPGAVGVPDIAPPEARVNPVGSAPEPTVKVMGVVPDAVQLKL